MAIGFFVVPLTKSLGKLGGFQLQVFCRRANLSSPGTLGPKVSHGVTGVGSYPVTIENMVEQTN